MRSLLMSCLTLVACSALADLTEQMETFRQDGKTLSLSALPSGKMTVGERRYTMNPARFRVLESSAKKGVELATFDKGPLATELSFLHTYQPQQGIADWRAACGLAQPW